MIASDLHLNQTAVLPKHGKSTISINVGFQTKNFSRGEISHHTGTCISGRICDKTN